MATKEELRAKLDELGVEQPPSDAKKEELEEAVAKAEGSSSENAAAEPEGYPETTAASSGHESEASDESNPEVTEELSPQGKEALDEMPEASAEEADLALDASGPLHLQAPSDRIMTGAVSDEQAEAFAEAFKDVPEGHTGDVAEDGSTGAREVPGEPKRNLASNDERDPEDLKEVYQEHVIDYPPTLADRYEQATGERPDGSETLEQAPGGAFHNEPLGSASNPGARSRLWEQKAVFYTDGLSGPADHNQERAYEIPEKLQSNDPVTRASGDESVSEAAREEQEESMSKGDKRQRERVVSGDVAEEQDQAHDR
jgi:hypothetical protein